MPNVSRALVDTVGGGVITGVLQAIVRHGGFNVAVVGALVADHGSGSHNAAHLLASSAIVRINGLGVVRAGDAATCGHLATGSSHVRVNA